MMFGLHVDDVNVIFGIDLWCFKVLGEVRAVRALYGVLLGLKISIQRWKRKPRTDGRNSAINEVSGIVFVTATQIHTRVWRPKTLVLIRSQYPRQSNDEFQQHCHECQKHSRDVVFQTAVEETVVNDPRGGVIEEGIPIVMLGWASYVKIIGE
jgi:hypothetical protein